MPVFTGFFSVFPIFWLFGWGIYDREYVILNTSQAPVAYLYYSTPARESQPVYATI